MSMFCFQCEQTYKGSGCTIQGVCGKKPDTANLQDELTSSIIELPKKLMIIPKLLLMDFL